MHLRLRNQLSTAKYYSIEDAKALVSPASPVVVIENDGVARAHPDAQMMRPHLAGNAEGLKGGPLLVCLGRIFLAYRCQSTRAGIRRGGLIFCAALTSES